MTPTPHPAPAVPSPKVDYVTIQVGEVDAIRATISFLASVIRCGEPYTAHVEQAVANAFERTARWVRDAVPFTPEGET